MGNILFLGEGQGDNIPPSIYAMNPEPPFNTTGESINDSHTVKSGDS
jgi:hypothetical protein